MSSPSCFLLQDLETVTPAEAAERIQQAEAMAKLAAHERIQVERRNLPMYIFRTDLMKAIAEYQIIIVVAETGSGKTTQVGLPVMLTAVSSTVVRVGLSRADRAEAAVSACLELTTATSESQTATFPAG